MWATANATTLEQPVLVNAQAQPAAISATEPRRIAIVMSAMGAGGAERVLSILANHWAAQGRKVTIVTFEPDSAKPYFDMDDRVDFVRLNLMSVPSSRMSGILRNLKRVAALRHALIHLRPDVTVSFLTKNNVLAVLASAGLGLPVVVSERNNPRKQPMHPLWLTMRDIIYRRSARLVVQTPSILELFPADIRARAKVIANPITQHEAVDMAKGPRTVTAVGRLTHQKGFDILLRAIASAAPKMPDWRFVIWGEGEERAGLERLRHALKLDDIVSFPGLTPRPGAWVEETGIFVLPSRYEGFPNVLGEAMAAGLPVIASDCPYGPGALIENETNGLLLEPENAGALALAMVRLAHDDDLRARLALAAPDGVSRYHPSVIAGQWDQVLSEARKTK